MASSRVDLMRRRASGRKCAWAARWSGRRRKRVKRGRVLGGVEVLRRRERERRFLGVVSARLRCVS